jgi:hypothetical protein
MHDRSTSIAGQLCSSAIPHDASAGWCAGKVNRGLLTAADLSPALSTTLESPLVSPGFTGCHGTARSAPTQGPPRWHSYGPAQCSRNNSPQAGLDSLCLAFVRAQRSTRLGTSPLHRELFVRRPQLSPKPAIAAVEALRDGRGRLRRAAEALHLFRPEQAFGGVGVAGGFLRLSARVIGADPRAPDPVTENPPSRWSAHPAITAALAAAGNATRI